MNKIIAHAAFAGAFALAGSGGALANGNCGMNSNKPCPPEKSSSKEPAYKSLNSNKPAAKQAGDPPVRTDVKSAEDDETPARATLSGISANDLKVKPKAGSTFEKEPAAKP